MYSSCANTEELKTTANLQTWMELDGLHQPRFESVIHVDNTSNTEHTRI